jgi:hypothetical protein
MMDNSFILLIIYEGIEVYNRFTSTLIFFISWLRGYATSRKVAGSSPDDVIGFFSIDLILLATLWPWGQLQPLTEMSKSKVKLSL